MKRSQPHRYWTDAEMKRVPCRVCDHWPVELAHTVGREHDEPKVPGGKALYVRPDSVVPLCKRHHDAHDGRSHETLDLLPYLDLAEQLDAVRSAGGIEQARVRLCPSQYRKAAAA